MCLTCSNTGIIRKETYPGVIETKGCNCEIAKIQGDSYAERWLCRKVNTAETEERAKYNYYLEFKNAFFTMSAQEFLKYVKCENLGFADITQLYGKEKHFRRVCRYRKIDFTYQGMRVQVAGRIGTIVGNYKRIYLWCWMEILKSAMSILDGKLLTSMKKAILFVIIGKGCTRYETSGKRCL
ncbi:hypothetical protein [Bacillus clarus]|uniref:Uncharacterized protein n=1 Tax=Bacillus clarus TaxID=2338372 RepID=A0A090YU45_9BACI|nr:hypothetical protein [Bacillus clarus]KFN01950.1 hypothetical protein DJ93_5271 [Bacillus clarus]